LAYPEPQSALEAGVSYLIQITAWIGTTQSQSSETVLLILLSTVDVEQVRQFEAQVEALDVSAESARFILAVYYADQELYDAAMTELISLAQETRSPLVHRLLGDVYLAVQLDAEATQSYEEAHKLAQTQDNRLVQAEAEVGLGHVAFAARRPEEALNHYQAALALYQELGLQNDAEAVAKLVADTETRLPTPTP
jgi:tetratricopeptide (TPR) repeat protein